MDMPKWSFSSLKLFDQCPKKYYHLKVLKDHKESDTEHTLYGTQFHEAAEKYVSGASRLPPQFDYAKPVLDRLKSFPGRKVCEYEMGLTADLAPCAIDAPEVWWRGIADLIIIDGDEARVVDYKTGGSAKYADRGQLELMALAVFKHFPEVQTVRAGLLFVVCKAFIKEKYTRANVPGLWAKWLRDYNKLQVAMESNTWNPRPSGLCKRHCIVESCPHNGRN